MVTIFHSPRDIRVLFPHMGSGTYPYILANVSSGEIVKRFSSQEDRDDYLTRNGYVAR